MAKIKLIADSGSTKTSWAVISDEKVYRFQTQGISPYFQTTIQVQQIMEEVKNTHPGLEIEEIYYYGTGCSNLANARTLKKAFQNIFPGAEAFVSHDLLGAARALCQYEKGVASILGTGSSTCYYNGNKIAQGSPGLGFILGDEGSGAYLGKKVIQYYLYHTFDEELKERFEEKFKTTKDAILEAVYKQPLPNRYLASFAYFLQENRGHYMIENIIEDGINDFFFQHIYKFSESWKYPIHFTGTISWLYRDVLENICALNELQLGNVLKEPIDGLITYHQQKH